MAHVHPRAARSLRAFSRSVDGQAPALEVLRCAATTLVGAVPADYWCGVLLDPSTLLDTGGLYTFSFPDSMLPRLFEIEHVEHTGADNLRALARRKTSVSVLSASTRGELAGDVYYRDILRPLGMGDEMRVLLREGRNVWGLLVWCRTRTASFSEDDVQVATALAVPAASALRGALLMSGTDRGELPDGTGLLVVEGDDAVASATPTARQWLDELQEEHPIASRLPNTVRVLAGRASVGGVDDPVRTCALTRRGRWAALQAWAIGEGRTAVAVGPAGIGELLAVILNAYNLTPREREVTQQVMRGSTTVQIARALSISVFTVQDHLQSIFRKVGVGSCRELMSAIFGRHYLPRLGPDAEPPLSTDGRLFEEPTPSTATANDRAAGANTRGACRS